MIPLSLINKVLDKSFYRKLTESIVPLVGKERDVLKNIKEINEYIHSILSDRTYSPSNPKVYLILNKNKGVSRIIPVFKIQDYSIYYLCVKILEDHIAVNRVENTFGGYRMGNPIKSMESYNLDEIEYSFGNSFNPWKWRENWKEFQQIILKINNSKKYKYAVKFDIANFYDSINLLKLKKSLSIEIPRNKENVLDLLFFFLENWNRRFIYYKSQEVGLPQDEFQECSRLLSNFYLQTYDQNISRYCELKKCFYVRYADDHFIFYNDKDQFREILLYSSMELFKLGLNINSSKVDVFTSPKQIQEYWCQDLFLKLDSPSKTNTNNVILKIISYEKRGIKFRKDSLIRRLAGLDLKYHNSKSLAYIKKELNNLELISSSSVWFFNKIEKFIGETATLKLLKKVSRTYSHTHFHYSFLTYMIKKKHKLNDPIVLNIRKKIKKLNKYIESVG